MYHKICNLSIIQYYVNMFEELKNPGYPLACGNLDCGREVNVAPRNVVLLVLSKGRAHLLGSLAREDYCDKEACGKPLACGTAEFPVDIEWLKDTVDPLKTTILE
jgi:hypothetical protein